MSSEDHRSRLHLQQVHTLIADKHGPKVLRDDRANKKIQTTQDKDTMKHPDVKSRRQFIKASSMFGVVAALSPALIREAIANPKLETIQKENTMTQASATGIEQASDKTAIRPFQ